MVSSGLPERALVRKMEFLFLIFSEMMTPAKNLVRACDWLLRFVTGIWGTCGLVEISY